MAASPAVQVPMVPASLAKSRTQRASHVVAQDASQANWVGSAEAMTTVHTSARHTATAELLHRMGHTEPITPQCNPQPWRTPITPFARLETS